MLILVRHGRTEANASGRLQGCLDLPLDEVGVEQVRALAEHLGAPDRMISSPLLRARQTAEAFGIPYDVDDRWEELHYGELEGRSMNEVSAETWQRWRTDPDFAPEGGESMNQLGARVWAACESLCDEAADQHVIVATHVSPIKAAVAWALNVDIKMSWRCHLDQASICRIAMLARGPVLVGFNEVVWA